MRGVCTASSDAGRGSGGRVGKRRRCGAVFPLPGGPSRFVPARQPRATGTPDVLAPALSDRSRQVQGPAAVERRRSAKNLCAIRRLKRSVHRGRSGANQSIAARDARTWWTCGYLQLDKPRCREASRPVGPLRAPGVPRAHFFQEARIGYRRPRAVKQQGRLRTSIQDFGAVTALS